MSSLYNETDKREKEHKGKLARLKLTHYIFVWSHQLNLKYSGNLVLHHIDFRPLKQLTSWIYYNINNYTNISKYMFKYI